MDIDIAPRFEKLIPLRPNFRQVPFPVEALPDPYRSMVHAVADHCQVDPAMPAVTCLSVLAAAAGGAIEVEVREGWREPTNLYTAIVAGPGERKSAVQAVLTGPILDAEEALADASKAIRLEQETLRSIATQAADQARKSASKDPAKQAEAISAVMAAEKITVVPVTRLLADDITPEAAGTLIAEQQRLAIISAEGGVLDIVAGRYSNGLPNLDLWLKGHAGDPLRIDRKGRDPEYVKKPSLTVGLMIQPTVLEAVGRNQQFRGRGLLARFLYAAPVSRVGSRSAEHRPIPADTRAAYTESVAALVNQLHGYVGDPVPMTLDSDAASKVTEILQATEAELAPGGPMATLRDWGSKYTGAVMRIAGLLHLAEHGPGGVRNAQITTATLANAVHIGTYFKSQALQAFNIMGADPVIADMAYTIDKITSRGETELSERDIFEITKGRFSTVSDLRPVLANLLDRGYLKQLPSPESNGPGRKPSPRYEVHPDVLD